MFTLSFRLAIISYGVLLRIDFHALVAMALTVGFSAVHTKNTPQLYPDNRILNLMTEKYPATGYILATD